MATNLQVDDKLIIKAVKLGGHKTKKAAVTQALIDYIEHLEQKKIFQCLGLWITILNMITKNRDQSYEGHCWYERLVFGPAMR